MKGALSENAGGGEARYDELWKEREIRFHAQPADQAHRASRLLAGLEGLDVRLADRPHCLRVRYNLCEYSLSGLIEGLVEEGFRLDQSLFCRAMRAFVAFSEETEITNLRQPERLIKRSNEIYVKAYQHHSHGDHDDTPPEIPEDR